MNNNEAHYFDVLKRIGRQYMTPDQIRRDAKNTGLSYVEYLEMSYENIQEEARRAIHRKRRPRAALSQARALGIEGK